MLKDTIEKGLLNIEELIDPARKEEFEKIKQEINAHLTQNPVTQSNEPTLPTLNTNLPSTSQTNPLPVSTPSPVNQTVSTSTPSDGSVNFFEGATLYKDPNSEIAQWLRNNATDSNFSLVQKLDEPTSIWLTGGTQDEVYKQVKTVLTDAGSKLVAFVVYNIPHRDNGGASAGGAADQAARSSGGQLNVKPGCRLHLSREKAAGRLEETVDDGHPAHLPDAARRAPDVEAYGVVEEPLCFAVTHGRD